MRSSIGAPHSTERCKVSNNHLLMQSFRIKFALKMHLITFNPLFNMYWKGPGKVFLP